MNTKKITLPGGSVLEVEHTEAFLNIVREKMEIDPGFPVEDDHIRAFIYGAFNNALETYEDGKYENSDDPLPTNF